MILAYETSTDVCSVSFQNKKGEIFEKRIQGRSVHSDHVFLFTKELMTEFDFKINDLNTVLVSNGPGSYTGLRIAASAIKGLLFGTDVSLYAVNTLASFAMCSGEKNGIIHAIIDARRTHVYHQSFKFDKKLITTSESKILDIKDFQKELKPGHSIIGTGTTRLDKDFLNEVNIFDELNITANALFKLYQLPNFNEFCIKTKPEELNPNYISSSQVNNT
ncbi:MAG: tRNA (adenosine(37)-N6)-threonylcarbamoyltransferase complex dimerization subunit type 1 TsaB [Balneolaceae bacterium]